MKNEIDHPCIGCEHFRGREDVKTLETVNGNELHIGIPICERVTYELTLGRCDEFSPTEMYRDMMSHCNTVLGHDIDKIWDESDAPEHSVTDRLDSMVAFVNDFHEFEHTCKDRGIVQTDEKMKLYHIFIINSLGGASE